MDEQKTSHHLNGHTKDSAEALLPHKELAHQRSEAAGVAGTATEKRGSHQVRGENTKQSTAQLPAVGSLEPKKKKRRVSGNLMIILGSAAVIFSAFAILLTIVFGPTRTVVAYSVGAQQNIGQYVGGGGIVYPHQQLDISYPVAEKVLSVMVKAGDQVNPNQPLIKLDPTQLDTQINQASNDVAAAQAYLNSVQGTNPVTTAAAQQALQIAQNKYNALVAQAASPTLHNGNLISPMKGIVTAVNVNPGEVFAADTILLTIMDQSSVTIRAKIPLSNLGQIHLGMPATITPSALPDLNIPGKVISVIPQADPQTDTFEVWVEVTNPQQKLLPGMSAFARIQGQVNAFVVPRLGVLNPDHEASVYVIQNNHVYQRAVHVVSRSTDNVYVDSGLNAGDKIVLIQLDKMHEGMQVSVSKLEH